MDIFQKSLIYSIEFYQTHLSKYTNIKCKFTPSCSQYTLEAIVKYGAWNGSLKGLLRILRCNPPNKDGYDPLEDLEE